MPYKKGTSGNPSGRKPGTRNRTTEQLRGLIQTFIERNWKIIQKDFDSLKPAERLNFLNSLLRHVLPDPVSFEKLNEGQLEQLHTYLLKKFSNDQAEEN